MAAKVFVESPGGLDNLKLSPDNQGCKSGKVQKSLINLDCKYGKAWRSLA